MDLFFAVTQGPCSSGNSSALIDGSALPKTCANSTTLTHAFVIAFIIIGGLAFLFLVIGGTRYAMSQGNPESMQKAKNQIVYSLIGLIIASMSAAIVNYVIGQL